MVYTKENGDKVDLLMEKFEDYCGVGFTYIFDGCYTDTEIDLGIHAISFREFVELETGCYITDSDWINTGVFTWEKLVEHLNKGVYNIAPWATPWVEDYEGFKVAIGMKKVEDNVLASFKVAEKENFSIPYNPVKNISIEKYYRCSKGAPSQCEQFYSGNGILFMSESDCGKYYYWEDYNSKNELIFFRGEKSWVEANYKKAGLCEQVIPVVKDGVTGARKVVDLGKVTLIGKKENNSPNVSDKMDEVLGKIKDRWEGSCSEGDSDILKVVATTRKGLNDVLGNKETNPTPIKSDGGKSDYYKIELPQWLLDKHSEKGFIMLEDLAEIMFENDFNFTNVFKAQKRMFELTKGQGKAGNNFEYDATKCKYYTDKQVEVFNRNKKC